MIITNRKNLPQIICDAVQNDPYDSGDTDYSASTLIKPAYQVRLQKEHAEEIIEDVSDRLWALYGSAVHYVIERSGTKNDDVETRYFAEVSGKKISAQIDHRYVIDGNLTDWKLISAYKIKLALQQPDEDWTAQLNVQAYLLARNDISVNDLYIGAMCRDWSKFSKQQESGYPDQIEYIKLPKWTFEQQEDYIKSRIEAMLEAKPCTPKERWQADPTFAIVKPGSQRAAKVEKTKDAALEYMRHKNWSLEDYSIETRAAPNKRCESYCNVNTFCEYYCSEYMASEDLPFRDL